MRFLCWFSQCQWQHMFNARRDGFFAGHGTMLTQHVIGVYQCPRCKSLSIGVARRDDGKVVDQT